MYPAWARVSTGEMVTITFSSDGPSWKPVAEVYVSFWEIILPSNPSVTEVIRKVYIWDEFGVSLLLAASIAKAWVRMDAISTCP